TPLTAETLQLERHSVFCMSIALSDEIAMAAAQRLQRAEALTLPAIWDYCTHLLSSNETPAEKVS
ncbi:MAG: hypothetical protein L7S70_06950, partial [Pseudomonadales bacterium]|nr:hypothetical protein [Pseudomonadales bacterium]